MLRIDPLRMYAEIVLQRSKDGRDLVGSERAADRQIGKHRWVVTRVVEPA